MVQVSFITGGHPALMAGSGSGHEVQHAQVAAQHPCLSVCDQWVEDAVAAEELAGIFLHPHP